MFFLFLEVCIAINFPLRTAFAASHRFQVVMFFCVCHFSRNFFISLLISSVTCSLFRNILLNHYVFVFFAGFPPVVDI